jgi:hypothetical protein
MIFSVGEQNLRAGLSVWRKRKWEQDFSAPFYAQQRQLLASGVSDIWWRSTLPELTRWKAIRPKRPSVILERGLAVLPEIAKTFTSLPMDSDFGSIRWDQVEPLFNIAWGIKGVNSPVFASKLCHFMRPDLYMVVDQEVIGVKEPYSTYWRACSEAWKRSAADHTKLKAILTGESECPLGTHFPFATKITELCVIGARVA